MRFDHSLGNDQEKERCLKGVSISLRIRWAVSNQSLAGFDSFALILSDWNSLISFKESSVSKSQIRLWFSFVTFYVSNYFFTVSSNHNDTAHNIVDDFKQTYSSSSGAESRSSRFFFTLPREFRSTIRFVSCVATTTRGSQTKRKFLTLISHLTRATCCFLFQTMRWGRVVCCSGNWTSSRSDGENFNWWLKTLTGFNWNLITVLVPLFGWACAEWQLRMDH